MSVQSPSQYECDSMVPGDVMFVKKRNFLYKFIRSYFYKDKKKINIRKDWTEPPKYISCYQEDCTIIYEYENRCVQKIDNSVPYTICYGKTMKPLKTKLLKQLEVTLYNVSLKFNNNFTIIFPISYIETAINKNSNIYKTLDDKHRIEESLKFLRYKGNYYKNFVIENNIKEWCPQYCSICGKPIIFKFEEDNIKIENQCECKTININLKEMSYDQLAIWYASQLDSTKKHYNKFWFNK